MGKMTHPMSAAKLAAIGARLREIIDESGKRQQDVALEAGIGIRTLGWYLSGRDIPTGALMRISAAVGMEPFELLRELTEAARAVNDG